MSASGSSSTRVVAVGGGHGLAATLRAVRTITDAVTAVVSVADDGGSSGRLRELLHIMAPGDLRKCMVALAEPDSLLARAFAHRFSEEELAGHALGNLVLAGLMEVADDPVAGIAEACRLLGVRGSVLPATSIPVVLEADSDGGQVAGQVAVMATPRIRRVSLCPPDAAPPPEAMAAIGEADLIVIGPGSLYTSVLAALVVPGIREALARAPARKVYVSNLRPQVPETAGFDVGMHVSALVAHGVDVDAVLFDPAVMPLGVPGVPARAAELTRPNGRAHDPVKLAEALRDLLG